jgi:hypothetical protein
MPSTSFLQRVSDDELQTVLQRGTIPAPFVEAEIQRRAQLRTAAEGANITPEYQQGLGAVPYG